MKLLLISSKEKRKNNSSIFSQEYKRVIFYNVLKKIRNRDFNLECGIEFPKCLSIQVSHHSGCTSARHFLSQLLGFFFFYNYFLISFLNGIPILLVGYVLFLAFGHVL